MIEEKLYDKAVRLLKLCPKHITLSKIADETSLKVSWLSELARGNIPDPGVLKIQELVDYLSMERPPLAGTYAVDEFLSWVRKDWIATVYIVFAEDKMIYVGSTKHPYKRLKSHEKYKLFMENNATHVALTYFEISEGDAGGFKAMQDARKLEVETIRLNSPLLNIRSKV